MKVIQIYTLLCLDFNFKASRICVNSFQKRRYFLQFAGFTYIHKNQIHHHGITPLWPQANAEVEKQNQSLLKRIIIAHTEKKHWKDELDTYLMMFRSSPHCVTWALQNSFGRKMCKKIPQLNDFYMDDLE